MEGELAGQSQSCNRLQRGKIQHPWFLCTVYVYIHMLFGTWTAQELPSRDAPCTSRASAVRFCKHAQVYLLLTTITSLFSSSDRLLLCWMSAAFLWHLVHKSVVGLVGKVLGSNFCQICQKVEYAWDLAPFCCVHTEEYVFHTKVLVVWQGRNWRSVLLYPGILPGSWIACSYA